MTTCRRWTTTTCGAASPALTAVRRSDSDPRRRRAARPGRSRCWPDGATHPDPLARCELVAAMGAASPARAAWRAGQMIDILAEGQRCRRPRSRRLQALKTGQLIQYSAEAGAILGPRRCGRQRARIAAYGRDLGAAFQIADDVLDAAGATLPISARPPARTRGRQGHAGQRCWGGAAPPGSGRPWRSRRPAISIRSAAAAHRLRQLASYVVAEDTDP